MTKRRLSLISLGCCMGFSPQLFAAEPSQHVVADVTPCLGIHDKDARLACFERVSRNATAVKGEKPAAAPAPAARATSVPTARAARAGNGNGHPSPARRAQASTSRDEAQSSDIISAIASIREFEPEQYVITLANGQVWHQVVPERYLLRPGDRVRLYPTHWGTHYRLTTPRHHGFIQVERLK